MLGYRTISVCVTFLASLAFASSASALVVYEWNEGGPGNGTNSSHVSHHTSGGPVLADDFIPTTSGKVVRVDWWGSAPFTASDLWELTFHNDSGITPPGTPQPAPTVLDQKIFRSSSGADPDGDGVFEFSEDWSSQNLFLTAGTDYWFSVANGQQGWLWADAGGPSPIVGSETFTGAVSAGAPGSPHFGPWASVSASPTAQVKQDFAFRIHMASVPEPGSMALFGIGLVGFAFARRRKTA